MRHWGLLEAQEGAGAAFQHVLTASTVTYDQDEHCSIRPRAWTDSQAIGGGPRGRERLQCKVIAYMKNRVRLCYLSIHNSLRPAHRRTSHLAVARLAAARSHTK